MDHMILRQVIADNCDVIRSESNIHRDYVFEPSANYILVGLRRAGKSILLHMQVMELIRQGVKWNQIIYINFEDERLAEFKLNDFNDILLTAAELSDAEPYYFFDEIQNIDGWERFARRLADRHARVWITGSNAKMLSNEMESRLGARYLSKMIMPYNFKEYLNALGISQDESTLYSTKTTGQINRAFSDYLTVGGLPESIHYVDKRTYAESIYQKILLGDIAARNEIRNVNGLRILIKKIAETVMHETSYTRLANSVAAAGVKISTDAVIQYVGYAKDAYLIFTTSNYFAKFSERERTPKYYFMDNAILTLFLVNKDSALFENLIASALYRQYANRIYFLKSARTDIDFYIPEKHQAIQAAISLDESSKTREINELKKLAVSFPEVKEFLIITKDQEDQISLNECTIKVMKATNFLLNLSKKEA